MTTHIPKAPSQRQLRVGESVRQALSEVLSRGFELAPEISHIPLTITQVSVSPDLRNALVFIIPLGGQQQEEVIKALRQFTPLLRKEIAQRVNLRYVPELKFKLDQSFDKALKIEALLDSVVRDKAPHSDAA